jgi:hypothetical protein
MNNLLNPHPVWCVGGPDCASGLHVSALTCAAPRGDEGIQVAAGLWQMDVGKLTPSGVLLEFSADDEGSERWLIDQAQARSLIQLVQRLQHRAEGRR